MDEAEGQGHRIVVSVSVLAALSTVFLALRLYCKLARHRRLWWDDHVLIISWVRCDGRNDDGLGRLTHGSQPRSH